MVFGKCDNSLDTNLGKRKNLIFNIVRHTHTHNRFTALWNLSGKTRVSRYQKKLFVRWPKIIEFYLHIQMLPAKLASL